MTLRKSQIKGIIILAILVCVSLATALTLSPSSKGVYTYELYTCSSYDELIELINRNYENYTGGGWTGGNSLRNSFSKLSIPEAADGTSDEDTSIDFSNTNIQVEGVDEPDIVKTDGTYLYIVAHQMIFIVKAYPPENANVLSEISFESDMYPSDIFIYKDRLIVFCTSYRYPVDYIQHDYWWGCMSTAVVTVYDISDRKDPEIAKEIETDGGYFDARMIGEYVYILAIEYANNIYHTLEGNETINIPEITIDNITKKIPADHVYYVDMPDRLDTMTHVISINILDDEVNQKSFLLGSTQTIYVSQNNIFLVYTKYSYLNPGPLIGSSINNIEESTIIHKISIDTGNITYTTQGEVPGRVLNQFSMDEYEGFFRLATTVGNVWGQDVKSSNNVYILDENLNCISEIKNIAPGEQIYSARFMGEKAYLVTFKKIDPFFTIDLSDPFNPKILGKLKIPGYSDYLHPYDENHIIGIGKDTVEALDSLKESRNLDFAWYQGLKIALFDVSDFANPKEVTKIIIGDRGTDSPALYDHKAFLFDKEKELLVIPINLFEISDEIKQQYDNYTGSIYGEWTFQGAYVYRLTIKDGFEYKGRITHLDHENILKLGYYGYWGDSTITRSLYIDNALYTISNNKIKINDLETLTELTTVEFV